MFPFTKPVGAKIGYVLGHLVHGKVVVEFGRIRIRHWLSIMKNVKYGETKHNAMRSSFFMHSKCNH